MTNCAQSQANPGQCLDTAGRATAGTICYFLSLSQTETLPGSGGDLPASGTSHQVPSQEQHEGWDA